MALKFSHVKRINLLQQLCKFTSTFNHPFKRASILSSYIRKEVRIRRPQHHSWRPFTSPNLRSPKNTEESQCPGRRRAAPARFAFFWRTSSNCSTSRASGSRVPWRSRSSRGYPRAPCASNSGAANARAGRPKRSQERYSDSDLYSEF